VDFKVKKNKSHFGKAIMLLFGLVLVVYFLNKLSTTNMIGNVVKAFEQSGTNFAKFVEFSEAERDSVKAGLSGFYSYTTDSSAEVYIDDRFEITKNGYIWQVERIRFALPSGTIKNLVHAVHAYLHPSSRVEDSLLMINCVIRTFNQLWIDEKDTCEIRKYFEFNLNKADSTFNYFDRVVDVNTHGREKFILEGRTYTLCENCEKKTFFPDGIIDVLYNQATCENMPKGDTYKITKGAVILKKPLNGRSDFDIRMIKECRGDVTLRGVIRESIAHDLQAAAQAESAAPEVLAVIKRFYLPYSIRPFIMYTPGAGNNGNLIVKYSFDITSNGATENVKITIDEKTLANKVIESEIAQEVRLWKFRPLGKEEPPIRVRFADTLNN